MFHFCWTVKWRRRIRSLLQRGWQLYFRGQLFHLNHSLSCQHHGIFDRVLQFANVARPRIIEQFLKRLWRNVWFWFAELLSKLFHERGDQRWDILFPFSKWRYLNLKRV